jgi:pimeloyl-ACP methyl ester carboxylesterase
VAKNRSGPTDFADTLIEGPWKHQFVSAGGLRFHVALTGPEDGQLVVLLHGVPQHWWSMRHLLVHLAAAGYRTAAVDLRGFGASDKPPEGYTLPMLARDVAGVIAALGHGSAVVAGQGLGGQVAWTMVSRYPDLLRGIVPICSLHPGSTEPRRRYLVSPRAFVQVTALRSQRAAQRLLTDAAFMRVLLATWTQESGWLDAEAARHYSGAMRQPYAAEKAARMMRWVTRPLPTTARRRFAASVRHPATVPVLHIQTDADPVLRWTVTQAEEFGGSDYRFELLSGLGHLPAEEDGELLANTMLAWFREHGI